MFKNPFSFNRNTCRLTLFLCLVIFFQRSASGQELPQNTIWEGKLAGLTLVLKISQDSLTKQKVAVFDSPNQHVLGLKVSKLTITNDSLTAYSSGISAGFYGKFNEDKSELSGKWKQGQELDLVLKRVTSPSKPNRPQTPKAPFPYAEEKVIYYNKDKSIQYGATLTLPPSVKKVPVIILITGSGQQDRDETLFGHKPFWVIADHLSRNGIAVLRVDDRGVGQTTGNVHNATSADFAKDVLVGIDYLKSRNDIRLGRIGLIGHSEGGVIAPLVANQSKDVAFIVSLAGVGITGAELMKIQLTDSYIKLGLSETERGHMLSFAELVFQTASSSVNKEQLKIAYKKSVSEWLEQQSDTLLAKIGFKGPNADKNIDNALGSLSNPWRLYFLNYDPALTLSKIQIPFLALNGGKDVQVRAQTNLAGFEKYLKQAGNKNYKMILLPNLNHLFQHAQTGEVAEYATIEETISPEVLTLITGWIQIAITK